MRPALPVALKMWRPPIRTLQLLREAHQQRWFLIHRQHLNLRLEPPNSPPDHQHPQVKWGEQEQLTSKRHSNIPSCSGIIHVTTTLASHSNHNPLFFLSSNMMNDVVIRLSSNYMVDKHTLLITLNNSDFDEFVFQQKRQQDIWRIRWGMELKISSFNFFNYLSCLITDILWITLTVVWLHQVYPSRPTLQRNSLLKKSYGKFP